MTDQAKSDRVELVQLTTGERFRVFKTTNHGVSTEKGDLCWDEIEGFWSWTPTIERRVFVPVDRREDEHADFSTLLAVDGKISEIRDSLRTLAHLDGIQDAITLVGQLAEAIADIGACVEMELHEQEDG